MWIYGLGLFLFGKRATKKRVSNVGRTAVCGHSHGCEKWVLQSPLASKIDNFKQPFLFYDEKLPDELYATDNRWTSRLILKNNDCWFALPPRSSPSYRFIDGTCRGVPTPAVAHFDRSNHHPKGLVKQAYSAKVQLGPNTRARKWHLTAYFSYEELENLPTIDDDVRLRRINPPPGVFRNGKSRSRDTGISMRRRSHSSDTASSSASSPPQSPIRTIRALPSFRPTQNTTARPKDEPLILPPLLSAIPRAFSGSSYVGAQKSRPVEDQRVIHMLNARHVSWTLVNILAWSGRGSGSVRGCHPRLRMKSKYVYIVLWPLYITARASRLGLINILWQIVIRNSGLTLHDHTIKRTVLIHSGWCYRCMSDTRHSSSESASESSRDFCCAFIAPTMSSASPFWAASRWPWCERQFFVGYPGLNIDVRIRVCIDSCVFLSSFANFLSSSRFRSQLGRLGAMLKTSCRNWC